MMFKSLVNRSTSSGSLGHKSVERADKGGDEDTYHWAVCGDYVKTRYKPTTLGCSSIRPYPALSLRKHAILRHL